MDVVGRARCAVGVMDVWRRWKGRGHRGRHGRRWMWLDGAGVVRGGCGRRWMWRWMCDGVVDVAGVMGVRSVVD